MDGNHSWQCKHFAFFQLGWGAIFLCCGVCHGIKLSNSRGDLKADVFLYTSHPASDMDSQVVFSLYTITLIKKDTLQSDRYSSRTNVPKQRLFLLNNKNINCLRVMLFWRAFMFTYLCVKRQFVHVLTTLFKWTLARKSNRALSWQWWMSSAVVTVETAENVMEPLDESSSYTLSVSTAIRQSQKAG